MDLPVEFGPYRLLRQIAMGGMAEIHLAKTRGFGGFEKLLALKMIHPKFSEDAHFINMLIEEAKICVQLSHMNIGQVFDLGRIGEHYYIAMEYIEGADLYKMMRRAAEIGVDVPIDSCVHVAHEICAGLDYAHRKRDSAGTSLGIIHRDMSPQNVLVSFAGEVKIVDFGIAKAALRAQQTEVGIIKGKYYYMSPEQAWGDPVDHRTDIFSAGIILYEMLTGQMLYLEDNIDVLLDRVRKADIAPPSTKREEVPPELDAVVMKALAKYPDDRYQTARELGHALAGFLFSFSPDFTQARLAGLMTWLLGEDRQGAAPSRERKRAEEAYGLSRDDFARSGRASGSLIFDLSHLHEHQSSDSAVAELDRTALLESPPVHRSGPERAEQRNPTDETAPVSIREDPAEARARARRFSFYSGTEDAPWGEDEDDSTLVEPEDRMLHRMADAAGILRAGRSSGDSTRRIEPGDLGARPARPSRPPPPAQRTSGLVVPPPRPSQPPPADADDDLTGPAASSASPPPGHLSPTSHGRDLGPLAHRGAPPKAPPPARRDSSAPPPGLPAGGEAPLHPPAGPPSRVGSPPEPPKAPPPVPGPPPPEAQGRRPGPSGLQAALAASADEGTGPTFVASLKDLGPHGPAETRGDRGAHLEGREPGGARSETGPTSVAPASRTAEVEARNETGPTVLAPARRPASMPPPPPGAGSEGPAGSREQGSAPPAPQVGVGPAPASQQPPWLFAGVPRHQPPADPDMLGSELLEGPPDGGHFDVAFRSHARLEAALRAATSPTGLKVGGAALAGLLLVVGLVTLWPRPTPEARLDIRSHPPGARVYLDGRLLAEQTPTTVEGLVLASVHQVELRLEGFSAWSQPVRMDDAHVRQIAVLSPIRGVLQVTSEPPGASVYVDGVYRGVTPREVDGLDINRPAEVQARLETLSQAQTVVWQGSTEKALHFVFEGSHRRRPAR